MLVLSRKTNEEIRIAESITVKVLEVRGNTVRLGIVAPCETPIWRPEATKKAA